MATRRVVLKYSTPVQHNEPTVDGSNAAELAGYKHILLITGLTMPESEVQEFIDDATEEVEREGLILDGEPSVKELAPNTKVFTVQVKGTGTGSSPIATQHNGTGPWIAPEG